MQKFLFIIFCSFIVTNCFAESTNYAVCNQPYALCTNAPCTLIPGLPGRSVCRCAVKNGQSIGQLACDKRKPGDTHQGQRLITSNFSFKEAAANKLMTCTGNHAWADCLDQPCIVDPVNAHQAICSCNVKQSEKFVTLNGQCNSASCRNKLYSASSPEMFDEMSKQLMTALNLPESPIKYCAAEI